MTEQMQLERPKSIADTLREKLEQKHYDQYELAKALGISQSMLNLVVRGKRDLGTDTLGVLLITFPELTLDIIDYLKKRGIKKKEAMWRRQAA